MNGKTPGFNVIGQLAALRRYALSLVRNPDEAEDLVHDALVKAYERQATFRTGASVRNWLMSILHNAHIDRLRQRRSQERRHDAAAELTETSVPANQDHSVRLTQLRDAFFALPEEQREALHLVAIEELSYQEAAETLGIPVGTLMSRVARARQRLRAFEQDGKAASVTHLNSSEALAMTSNDPILESDLNAYVDDQLAVGRRIEVEAYLSERPEVAAQIMKDLRVRDELRLALADHRTVTRQATREAARLLERSLSRRRLFSVLRRAAAVALLVAAGWTAHAVLGPFGATEVVASMPPPAFVEEAVRAHRTTLLRDSMTSQPETETFDRAEIRSATAIVLPELPEGWIVIDTQVFPSAYGPSVELVLEPRKGERLSLFAVRPGSFAVQHVLLFHADNARAAYWQIGDVAYALVSEGRKADDLTQTARDLSRTLY